MHEDFLREILRNLIHVNREDFLNSVGTHEDRLQIFYRKHEERLKIFLDEASVNIDCPRMGPLRV